MVLSSDAACVCVLPSVQLVAASWSVKVMACDSEEKRILVRCNNHSRPVAFCSDGSASDVHIVLELVRKVFEDQIPAKSSCSELFLQVSCT